MLDVKNDGEVRVGLLARLRKLHGETQQIAVRVAAAQCRNRQFFFMNAMLNEVLHQLNGRRGGLQGIRGHDALRASLPARRLAGRHFCGPRRRVLGGYEF